MGDDSILESIIQVGNNDARILNGDCLEVMAGLDAESIDAIVTDPPYGLAFMGAEWDSFNGSNGNQTIGERQDEGKRYAAENSGAPRYANSHGKRVTRSEMVSFQEAMTPIFAEALRVAKPGAHMLCFGGTRTFHRIACSLEDAGWEIRDTIMWVYGCLDEETEVLVDGDFVPYNKAKIGSLALGYDIEKGTFSWQRIEDTYLYDYDDTAYAIQSDSTDQLVSRNHRCVIERGGVEQFAFAEQIALEREACVPVLESLHDLLDRLPLPDKGADGAKQNVLEEMCASHRPRPTGQQTREPDAVSVECGTQDLRGLWGAKSTLARVTPVHYKGKMWCVKVRTGAFVARRRGKIFVTGNSGFPKSMDVAKAIDKAGGVNPELASKTLRDARERSGMTRADVAEFVGCTESSVRDWEEGRARRSGLQVEYVTPSFEYREKLSSLLGFTTDERVIVGLSVDRRDDGSVIGLGHSGKVYGGPRTEAAREWDGWGTCLKPAWEPIIVARKPLDGTVAHNVLTYGTGAINIDGCRVPTQDKLGGGLRAGGAEGVWDHPFMHDEQAQAAFVERKKANVEKSESLGRFPANLVHDGSRDVLNLFPDTGMSSGGGMHTRGTAGEEETNVYGSYTGGIATKSIGMGDFGSAARFFYCAKASKKDRGNENDHPTVKPNALMRWLVRLVCHEGGVVMDPFMGSGSTGVACINEGMDFVGVDLDPHYCEIASKRISEAGGTQMSLF